MDYVRLQVPEWLWIVFITRDCMYTKLSLIHILHGEKGPFIVCFFSAFSCLVTLPFLIFDYHYMSLTQIGTLLAAGLAAAGGQFTITAAYSLSLIHLSDARVSKASGDSV